MSSTTESSAKLHSKVRQLYDFLKEVVQIRFKPIRTLDRQQQVIRLSEMPKHPSVQLFRPVETGDASEVPEILIQIARPKLTKCPEPPAIIRDWLLPSWDDPFRAVEVTPSQNITEIEAHGDGESVQTTKTILFEDSTDRVEGLRLWVEKRNLWIEPERVARSVLSCFESFYKLHARIEKEGEQLELLIADGILSWCADSGNDGNVVIHHPIIQKRVELRFDPNVPEFTVRETDREVELYSSLFFDLKNVDSKAIRARKSELEATEYHPLGWEDTTAYLKSVAITLSPTEGEYLESPGAGVTNHPRIWRDPHLILRNRTAGISNAVDKIISHIDSNPVFPPALAQITGENLSDTNAGVQLGPDNGEATSLDEQAWGESSSDVLLVNPANKEQLEIIRRLNRSGSVVVQGPPGTGKTHTISNLIGHLLSQGKSILITAHTIKALRVLRDKVPDMLKPLCVSVLGSDDLARRQLESAISSITERLTSETQASLQVKSNQYEKERAVLVKQNLELRHSLREAIENEYRDIELGGKRYSPADAARLVAANRDGNDWIPGSINLSVSIEDKINAIERLYGLGTSFLMSEENDSRGNLPNVNDLPTPVSFAEYVADYRTLTTSSISWGSDFWVPNEARSEEISVCLSRVQKEFNDELLAETWRPFAIVSGIHGGLQRKVWESLIERIEQTVESGARQMLTLQHSAVLTNAIPAQKQLDLLNQVCSHLEGGGKLGFIQLATKGEWRQLINSSTVAAGTPSHIEHFKALRQLADVTVRRLELKELWNNLIAIHTNKPFDQLGAAPEQVCQALLPELKRCLDWHEKTWLPLASDLKKCGLKLDDVIATSPRDTSQVAEYLLLEKLAKNKLIDLLEKEILRRKLREIESSFRSLEQLVVEQSASSGVCSELRNAIVNKNTQEYKASIAKLERIHSIRPLVKERDLLLSSIQDYAPSWANEIRLRLAPHDQLTPPGDIRKAWLWRQLVQTLDARSELDAQKIQEDLERNNDSLRDVTRLLVDSKAWSAQLGRLQADNSIRQALVGWLDTAKRLASTRIKDKRLSLLSEARRLMKKCSEAVPVWIMPISIMAESFEPQITEFDVVIIDEASQADITALIPLYMGKQIIVVGDHEQVTPLGVGQDQTLLENLRRSMLSDIPNAHLYDNMSSIYDLARQSFGEGVRLVEHFRCVPQIIGFSNALSYEGKIRPLREASSSNLKPACIPHRIKGIRKDDINEEEAGEIVSLIKAMLVHKEYLNKSIGVISMLGERQAILIQSMIHKEISSVEIESRRIQAGIAGEFQGDERDVIFLSMVDSAADTNPLRSVGEGAFELNKKRYNVATSRARDQLWVVHSFDPELHLKSSDIRFRLLEHVKDPDSSIRNFAQEVGRTESPFEIAVLKILTNAGYKVRTQVEVGYFRIDLVVEGQGKRLAVECDGDRYHPIEKLAEDMNRQAILERLGWIFVRIRGSAFYRDPDKAMEPVFRRLEELEILPLASGNSEGASNDTTIIEDLLQMVAKGFKDDPFEKVKPEGISVQENLDSDSVGFESSSNSEMQLSQADRSTNERLTAHKAPSKFQATEDTLLNESADLFPRSRSSAFNEYRNYSGPPRADPRTAEPHQIAQGLLEIIKAETPVQTKRTFDIYLRSCGIKRMGHELRNSLSIALNSLKRSNQICSHQFKESDGLLEEVLWIKDTPSETLRRRGDRTLDEIPLGELRKACLVAAELSQTEIGSEGHLRAILEFLDLKRLTTNAEEVLQTAISGDFNPIQSE